MGGFPPLFPGPPANFSYCALGSLLSMWEQQVEPKLQNECELIVGQMGQFDNDKVNSFIKKVSEIYL